MLYYNGIDISEGTDINNASASKDFLICHYFQTKRSVFKQPVSIDPADINSLLF